MLEAETEWLVIRAALAGGTLAAAVGVVQLVLGSRNGFWVAVLSAVLCFGIAGAWKLLKQHTLIIHLAVGSYTLLFCAGVVWGSIDYIVWLGLVSLISFMVLGQRHGLRWNVAIFATLAVAIAARLLLIDEPMFSTEKVSVRLLRVSSLLSIFSVVSFLYEQQRQRNIENLEQAMAARSRLLAQVSHEMRTPLNGIIGATEALRLGKHDAEVTEGLDTIDHSGRALLTLINDLLEFARAEAGKTEFEVRAFDLVKVVERTVAAYRARATAAGATLEVVLPEGTLGLLGDGVRIQQVLGNLVSNAVRHGAGTVKVGLTATRHDEEVRVALAVSDEGPGLSAEQQARLFEPFVQLNPRTAVGGSGLGLFISRAIARELGGDLTVDGGEDRGCTFTFRFALPRAALDTEPVTPAAALHGRVLVVDDNPINRKVATALLQKLGLAVEAVDSGVAALTHSDDVGKAIDLVLMDLQMPELDGFETTRRLRAAGFRAPIVALTASALPETEAQCLDAGMSGYLSKPLRLEHLVPLLTRWLPA